MFAISYRSNLMPRRIATMGSMTLLLLLSACLTTTAIAHDNNITDQMQSEGQGSQVTSIPKKRPSTQHNPKKFTNSLKDPIYQIASKKIWSCAFFNCNTDTAQRETTLYAPIKRNRPTLTQNSEPDDFQTRDRLSPKGAYRQAQKEQGKQTGRTKVAVLRIDAELKRLILALLKQKQPGQDSEDSHCQDMVRGIAYKVHHSPNREQLGRRTRDLALDMQYYCRKQHFIKAYDSYQKLMTILDDNIR